MKNMKNNEQMDRIMGPAGPVLFSMEEVVARIKTQVHREQDRSGCRSAQAQTENPAPATMAHVFRIPARNPPASTSCADDLIEAFDCLTELLRRHSS